MSDGNRTETEVEQLWRALLRERADRLADTSKLLRQVAHLWFALAMTLLTLAVTIVLALVP